MTGPERKRQPTASKEKLLRAYLEQVGGQLRPTPPQAAAKSPASSSISGRHPAVAAKPPSVPSPAPTPASSARAPTPAAAAVPAAPPASPRLRPLSDPPSAEGGAGRVGGKYRLLRTLGKGGVGEVVEAVHEVIGSRVAIKFIREEHAGSPELAARFLQEARAAAAIGHPGIVQIFDVGIHEDGRTYLVMEYLDGEDLQAVMRRDRRLAVAAAVPIFIEVLEALSAVHAKGIVHRDMKPENVYLVRRPHGEPGVKLLDFGIARLADEEQAATRLTRPGSVMGTPYYMSPEQARGDTADSLTDVYAVGVMLFEALTGRLPFEGSTYNEVLSKVIEQPFPDVRTYNPDVPRELERVLQKAAARRKTDRYRGAAEFAAALEPFRTGAAGGVRGSRLTTPPGIEVPRSLPPPAPERSALPVEPAGEDVTDTPTRPPRRSSTVSPAVVPVKASMGRQLAIVLGGAALSGLLVVGGLLVGLEWRGSDAEPARAASDGPPPPPPAARDVRIRVLGAPDGSEIRYDGRQVDLDFQTEAGEAIHRLEIVPPGGEPIVRLVRPAADVLIDLSAELPALSENPAARATPASATSTP